MDARVDWDRAVLAAVLSGAGLAAQATHLVGPGGHAQIYDAIAVASDGDVILVQPGNYVGFITQKSLTIRGTAPGVNIGPGPLQHSMFNLGSGPNHEVQLVDLRFHALLFAQARASLDGVTIDSLGGNLLLFNSVAVLQDCVVHPQSVPILGSSPGIQAHNSTLTLIDSRVHGASAPTGGYPVTAISLANSKLLGSGLDLATDASNGSALVVDGDAASTVWLADSTVQSGWWMCPVNAGSVRFERTTVTPSCPSAPTGNVIGVHRPAPPQAGAPFVLEFRFDPNQVLGVQCAWAIAATTPPLLEQSLLLPTAQSFAVGLLFTGPNGLATGTWSVPAGPHFAGQQLWFQAFGGTTFPLQASALAGGIVR
ncbi:MAG: hypothetical protein JNK15_04935 [Planctomycetes bacterium]|nr:hypothetical protein [Planctomycetota bacterium]